jgi:general secretion pathway protein A
MYNTHFGFKEKPFKLVPNPEYLFLSRSHEEALGHLKYAVSQGEGFVEIIGEVGTGKTTLCRAFLESLDDSAVAAYIFNPRLGPKQLIKTINDEFGIAYDADNTKDLIDQLNAFLLRQKAAGRRVIVIIDEAQNLSKIVLEQLRLLSNLETNREKLLQIILVGQPELAEMLESYDLRQIGQRISLRYQIQPLSLEECREYIAYRLNVASHKRAAIFTPAACRRIYAFSKGIPRLINIACDRALLAAFGRNRHKVTAGLVDRALREMGRRPRRMAALWTDKRRLIGALVIAGVLAAALAGRETLIAGLGSLFRPSAPAAPPAAPAAEPAAAPAAGERPARSFSEYLKGLAPRAARLAALRQALAPWGVTLEPRAYLDDLDDDEAFFTLYAKTAGFFVHRIESDLRIIRRLNMPAILELRTAAAAPPVYLALTAIADEKLLLTGPAAETIAIGADDIWQNWTGVAYLPWKNFLSLAGTIPTNAPPDSILALKMILHESGFANVPLTREYDPAAQKAVEQLQAKYGLPVDGRVGPLTKIILYREQKTFDIPRLVDN